MATDKYLLVDKKAVPCDDLLEWAKAFETTDRRVAKDFVGPAQVSTVFLCLDHNFWGEGPPLLFETMVFGGPLDGEQDRCSTWEQAEDMHARMLKRVKEN
jgi:hypothetical protein